MKQGQKDLYVLVADQDMRQTMKELLDRGASLGIPSVTYTVARHLQRDPGCRSDASRYLRHRILQCQDPAFNELRDTLQLWFPAMSS